MINPPKNIYDKMSYALSTAVENPLVRTSLLHPRVYNEGAVAQTMSWLLLGIKTLGLVLFYYCFSIGLTFYNKRILTVSIGSSERIFFLSLSN